MHSILCIVWWDFRILARVPDWPIEQNFLRMSFYPDHYTDMSPVHGVIHRGNSSHFPSVLVAAYWFLYPNLDHCIDHLRQLVQCQGDITPIPTRYREGIGLNYIDSDRWHTCRDWSSITQWVEKRFAESRKVIAEQTNGEVDFHPWSACLGKSCRSIEITTIWFAASNWAGNANMHASSTWVLLGHMYEGLCKEYRVDSGRANFSESDGL